VKRIYAYAIVFFDCLNTWLIIESNTVTHTGYCKKNESKRKPGIGRTGTTTAQCC